MQQKIRARPGTDLRSPDGRKYPSLRYSRTRTSFFLVLPWGRWPFFFYPTYFYFLQQWVHLPYVQRFLTFDTPSIWRRKKKKNGKNLDLFFWKMMSLISRLAQWGRLSLVVGFVYVYFIPRRLEVRGMRFEVYKPALVLRTSYKFGKK